MAQTLTPMINRTIIAVDSDTGELLQLNLKSSKKYFMEAKEKSFHGRLCIAYARMLDEKKASADMAEKIRKCVLNYFNIPLERFVSKSRKHILVESRQFYFTLCKLLTPLSLKQIGLSAGGKDHSTVINSVRTFSTLLDREPELKQVFENMKADVMNKPIPYPENYKYNPPLSDKEYRAQLKETKAKLEGELDSPEIKVEHIKDLNGYSHNREAMNESD